MGVGVVWKVQGAGREEGEGIGLVCKMREDCCKRLKKKDSTTRQASPLLTFVPVCISHSTSGPPEFLSHGIGPGASQESRKIKHAVIVLEKEASLSQIRTCPRFSRSRPLETITPMLIPHMIF